MNKEEILRKSRNEKIDEGILNALNQSYQKGIRNFCIIFIPLAVIALIKLRVTDLSLLLTIFYGFYASFVGNYRKALNDHRTLLPRVMFVLSIVFFVLYVKDVFF